MDKGLDANFMYKYLCGGSYRMGTAVRTGNRSGMSDIAIMKATDKMVAIPGGWSNGEIALLDGQSPEKRPGGWDDSQDSEVSIDTFGSVSLYTGQDVSSVTVFPWGNLGKIVGFSDGNGTQKWFSGKYITALLKRCNRQKSMEYLLTTWNDKSVLMVGQNDKVIGFVAPLEGAPTQQDIDAAPIAIQYQPEPIQSETVILSQKPPEPESTPIRLVQPETALTPAQAQSIPVVDCKPAIRKRRGTTGPLWIAPAPEPQPEGDPAFYIVTTGDWGHVEVAKPVYV